MALNPMEQFAVKPLVGLDQPLFHIGGHPIYFTNQSLLMVIVVVAASPVPHPGGQAGPPGAHPQPVDGGNVLRIRRQHDPFGDRRRRAEILPLRLHALHLRAVLQFLRHGAGQLHRHQPDRGDLRAGLPGDPAS